MKPGGAKNRGPICLWYLHGASLSTVFCQIRNVLCGCIDTYVSETCSVHRQKINVRHFFPRLNASCRLGNVYLDGTVSANGGGRSIVVAVL